MTEVEGFESAVKRAVEGARGFAAEMREKGIHVGMGGDPYCVTCDERWPCAASKSTAVAGAGHVEDVPLSASEPTHDPKAGVRQ